MKKRIPYLLFLIVVCALVAFYFSFHSILTKAYSTGTGAAEAEAAAAEAEQFGGNGDGDGGDGGGDSAGDGVCGASETCETAPQDCGSCCVSNVGSACGSCGGIVQCDGSCSIPTPPNYGQSCGSCGRGRIDCSGNCVGDYSNCGSAGWYDTGSGCGRCGREQRYCNGCDWGDYRCVNEGPCWPGSTEYGGSCGNCGTYRKDCAGNCQWGGWYCSGEGPCSPGQTRCSGSRYQTCTSGCQWQNSGTDSDGDGVDVQCGDSLCDNNRNFVDANRQCDAGQRSCSGDTTLVCNACQWQSETNCNNQDGWYCNGATREYRDYGCSAGSCTYIVTSSQNCNSLDGWYGGGNTQTATCGSTDNDASSEFRDYGCSAGSCTSSVTQTKDCDNQDGWYGGGNNAGCGSDPNSVWNDYYVITNTNSCTSTTSCSGTGSVNCDSSDICNNKCEGTIFTSVPPMKDYYVVSNSNSCTSTTDSPVTEDCATKASTDSDGSPTAYTVPGTVTDYSTCTLGGCTGTTYSDSCSGTILTEYGTSGSSFTSSQYECQNFESNYCSNDRYYRNEWTCSGSPGACTDAADSAIGTNADGDAKDLQCGDSLCDNAAGVYDSTKTSTETNCADGLDNDCDGAKDCADSDCAGKSGPGGVLCCQTASNCAQDDCVIESCVSNTCQYTNRNACDSTECSAGTYCDSAGGNCANPDNSNYVCLNCVSDQTSGLSWTWNPPKHEDAGKAFGGNLFNSQGACTPASGGACFDKNNNPINHKPALTTGQCCGDDPNEFYKPDYHGAECTNNVNDCVWSTGDAQGSDSGNPTWWCYLGKWDECTQAAHIGKKHGSAFCAGSGTGWTINPLPENQYGPNACTDGLDNDADGVIDCADTDCAGSIAGNVKNQDNQPVSSADVSAKKDLTTNASSTTNTQGSYNIASINCGTYNLVASHPDYAPQTKSNVVVNPQQQTTVNFEGSSALVLGTSCEADCTFASDNIIHASCDGKNGCTFYDSISKAACDNSQPGWVRDYNSSHYVVCASGSPQPKVEIEASVTCASGTLVKVTRIVVYNGVPVKLVVATCG